MTEPGARDPRLREATYPAPDGRDFFYSVWEAAPPRGVLVFVHGFGEHSGLYGGVARHFAARGYSVYVADQRGHGRSPGARGHVDSWADFRGDLGVFLAHVEEQNPSRPIVLVGNSMGAAVALDYALHAPGRLRGVVASSAPLAEVGVPVWLRALGRVLAKVWPSFAMDARLDLSNLTRDEEAARAIVEDPLFHQRGTARLMEALTAVKAEILERAGEFRLPLLLLHGSDDKIASPEGSRRFLEGAASLDKVRKEYEGARHNLFHETNRLDVFRDLEAWIEPRLAEA